MTTVRIWLGAGRPATQDADPLTLWHERPSEAVAIIDTIREAVTCGLMAAEPAWELRGDPAMVEEVREWMRGERAA